MAAEDQGIMSLPQAGAEAPAPQMSMDEAYDAVQGGLQDASPQAAGDLQGLLREITPMLDQLSDEELDSFLEMLQYLIEHPEEYKQRVSELVAQGTLEEGMLPDEYDPELLSALAMVFFDARRQRQAGNEREMTAQMPQPPMAMARGGIAEAARMVASKGRNGDSMLAHITPSEAKLLKSRGGSGTINPETGLPEFFIKKLVKSIGNAIKGVVKSVVNTVKKVVKSPIGRMLATVALATFLGPGAFGVTGLNLSAGVASALASGTVTAIGGGNLKDVLRSAATAYLGAPGGPVSQYIGNAGAALGVTNAAGQAAINAGLTGVGVGVLTGQKLGDAVKSGLIAGAVQGGMTGFKEGFGAQVPSGPKIQMPLGEPSAAAPVPETAPAPGQVNPQASASVPGPSVPAPGAPSEFMGPGAQAAKLGPEFGKYETTMSKVGNMGSDLFGKAKGLYNEYLSPSGIQERGAQDALAKVQKQFPNATVEQIQSAPAGSALAKAYSNALPGTIATYGPLAAAGLGIAGLMGGFSAKKAEPSEMAREIQNRDANRITIEQDPSRYYIQGLPGVKYDEKGNIIGSQPWQPKATMDDVRVPSTPTGSVYTPPPVNLLPPLQTFQPYNTASMYTNLMPPIGRASGGVASLAQGGYPRRTGQISGPGTETSDSIPAMLSDGEFVMTAKAVRAAGKGDRRAGAKKMYALMHQLERNASRG